MSDETVSLCKGNLLKAHAEGCSDVKETLERLYPGVFNGEWPYEIERGMVFIWKKDNDVMIAARHKTELLLQSLRDPKEWVSERSTGITPNKCRLMISGTITITVKDGRVAGAEVQET